MQITNQAELFDKIDFNKCIIMMEAFKKQNDMKYN